MTLQQHRLPELLSNYRILTAVIPHLLLKDFLNLIAVSRDVREAVSARSAQSSTEATDELQRLQHVLVLLSLTGRCKSPHKSAIRIGVGSCVWCGEGVCRSCNVSAYLPSGHRLRRLCSDCYTVDIGHPGRLDFKFVALPELLRWKRLERFCTCQAGEVLVCPDCPWQEIDGGAESGSCWVCERRVAGCNNKSGGWFCLWCERRCGDEAVVGGAVGC